MCSLLSLIEEKQIELVFHLIDVYIFLSSRLFVLGDEGVSVCPAVPDPPRNLQLSCDNGEDGTVEVSWSPPDKGHGLIREYIVSSFHLH